MKKEKKLASTPVWFEHTLPKEMPVCFVYTIAGPVWISEGIISRVLGGLHRVNHSAKVPVVGSKTAYFIIILSLKKNVAGTGSVWNRSSPFCLLHVAMGSLLELDQRLA